MSQAQPYQAVVESWREVVFQRGSKAPEMKISGSWRLSRRSAAHESVKSSGHYACVGPVRLCKSDWLRARAQFSISVVLVVVHVLVEVVSVSESVRSC